MIIPLTEFAADITPTIPTSASTIIIVAVLSLIGTIATVGYKYRTAEKRKDPNQIIFDQVNKFIAEQRQERDDLRKELSEVKNEVRQLNQENERLKKELSKFRYHNAILEQRISSLTSRADNRDVQDGETADLAA